MDFSEFETTRSGIWRICAVIDYATTYCLAATVTSRSHGADAPAALPRAVAEAERVLDLDDPRADRGQMDVVDADERVIGETPAPIAVVTDNSPCFRAERSADAFAGERFFGTPKYELLYRAMIGEVPGPAFGPGDCRGRACP